MDLAIARLIKDAADSLSLEMTVIEDYSGREMFGTQTAAITTPHLLGFAAAVGQAVLTMSRDRGPWYRPGTVIDAVADLRSDNLGHDIIVY